ncbi:polysaccharide biosynthesis/export family protein [Sandaracinobacteroides sp. A072]|uniref:polysaccharide biosynthesis/export family protein n=1 Tax=Sandaracinobacteroides sp. A072 TaxID=3461146 RepID=UPI00404351ED
MTRTRTGTAGLASWMLALFGMIALAVSAVSGAPAAAQGAQGSVAYVLGPNDGINVIVYGQSEFNVQTRVKPDGSIVMPLIGKVQAEGRTVITLADEVTRRLVSGNFLKDPIVNVEVTDYASRYVRVAGKISQPGLIPLERSNRILDVLLRAGWVREGASQFVTLRRAADGKEVRIDTDALGRGQSDDIALQAGDTLFVADAELVYLTGQVNRPGPIQLRPGMTVSEALAMAGGVGASGSSNRVGLRREGEKERDVDQQTELKAGDIINVRERLF